MQEPITISGRISTSDPTGAIGAEIWIDDHCVIHTDWVQEPLHWHHVIDAAEPGAHELRLVMKHKRTEHTQIDSNGNVISDVWLQFDQHTIDDLDIDSIIRKISVYTHDFNGHGELTTSQFHNNMGCNGTVVVPFSVPFYIWYLENR